jgi:hypothetical protein
MRHAAIIQLKNGIDKYWRSTAKNAIPASEKETIRSRLFGGTIDEEHRPLAVQNALTTAKIIRTDYLKDWSDALKSLIHVVRETVPSPARLHGALLLILQVMKELSTARIKRHQDSLRAVSPELVELLTGLYTNNVAYWVRYLTKGEGVADNAPLAMENSLASIKLLRRLMVAGYEHPHLDGGVQQVWQLSQTQFGQFMELLNQDSHVPATYQDIIGKHLLQFTKLHCSMAEYHPGSFALLPDSLPLVRSYWGLIANFADVFEKSGGIKLATAAGSDAKSKMEGPLLEKLALKGLLLLRMCVDIANRGVTTMKYRNNPEILEQHAQSRLAVQRQLLTDEFVLEMVRVIITKLFIFRQSDLQAWEDDPEEWQADESRDSAWEWAVRPCSERLFLDLLISHKEVLRQPLLDYFAEVANPQSELGSNIVKKEAVYAAMSCATACVHEDYDFDALLTTTLLNDLRLQDPLAKLLRRRVAILLAGWIPVRVNQANKAIVYEIYRYLTDPNYALNDEVVCFTAARNLQLVVDEYEFASEGFMPFASDTLSNLISLLKMAELDDTKQALLATIAATISRMDTAVAPLGDVIMSVLPQLWDSQDGESYVVKVPILSIITTLVHAMRGESQRYHPIILPLLKQALEDPHSPLYLHLVEEAVDLWNAVLYQTSAPLSADLVALAPLALEPVEYDTQVAQECIGIVKSYLLLAPQEMLADAIRKPALDVLIKALYVKDVTHAKAASYCIETMIRIAHTLGGDQGITVVIRDLVNLGFVQRMVQDLIQDWKASKAVGPNKPGYELTPLVEEQYFAILARLALASPVLFIQLLTSFEFSLDEIWACLIMKWFDHFDHMSGDERKKLSCLAITRLVELPDPVQTKVLSTVMDFMIMWIGVVKLLQLETDGSRPQPADNLIWTESGVTANDTAVAAQEKEMEASDPVHTVHMYTFMQERFQGLVQRVDEQNFRDNWLINVDKEVVDEFRMLDQLLP